MEPTTKFSLSLFNNVKLETTISNLSFEKVYSVIPEYVFLDQDWFFNSEKDTKNILQTMLIGESYKVAWTKNHSRYLLITKNEDEIIIIDTEGRSPNLIKRNLLSISLPPSDDDDDDCGDKSINYTMICFRYVKQIKNWYGKFEFFKNPILPFYRQVPKLQSP